MTIKCLSVFIFCLSGLIQSVAAQEDKLALVGGTLIDGSGAQPLRNSIVLIDGDRISRVGTMGRLPIPEDYRLISTEGMTVIPGLWDSHVHLQYSGHPDADYWLNTYADDFAEITIPASARQLLMAGVTSVRDLAVNTADILQVRETIESGASIGPTIYTAGSALVPGTNPPRPHFLAVNDPADAAAKTITQIERGMDFIKVLGFEPDAQETVNAIVETAHARGVRVTAHGRSDVELRVALRAGVDEIQHIGTDSSQYPDDVLQLIRERISSGIPLYWNPTIGLTLNADELAAEPEWLEHPNLFSGLPETLELDIRRAIATAEFSTPSPEAINNLRRKLQQLNELGVIMVFGSGTGNFGHPAGEATWRELEAWVFELGMDPLTAIKWATADAAAYMGVDADVGTIDAGKIADIIAVQGSPLRHFSTLRDPAIVIKRGIRYK